MCRRKAKEKPRSLISARVLQSQAYTILIKQASGTSTLTPFPRSSILRATEIPRDSSPVHLAHWLHTSYSFLCRKCTMRNNLSSRTSLLLIYNKHKHSTLSVSSVLPTNRLSGWGILVALEEDGHGRDCQSCRIQSTPCLWRPKGKRGVLPQAAQSQSQLHLYK